MRLALVDDDREFSEFLSNYLQDRGIQVDLFSDSNDLLADTSPYTYDFYVLDLMLPGVDGVDLIKILRRRSDAGILVVSGRLAPDVFKQTITAGADMYLSKPVQFEQVAVAIEAVQRRVVKTSPAAMPWTLDKRARQLIAPDGARVDLSEADLAVMDAFSESDGGTVTRENLLQRLGHTSGGDAPDGLNASIYRLRRRIERATPVVVPLQSKSRVGYVFRATLKVI